MSGIGRAMTAAGAALATFVVTASASADVSLQPVGSYDTPMYVTSAPGDPDRLFVAEREGFVMMTTPQGTSEFLDIPVPVYESGEQGLYSIAFPPDYASSGLFYVAYSGGTSAADDAVVVDEYRATGDVADPASRRQVIAIPHPGVSNHNGGQLQFGPDGYLYLSIGDAANGANAQNVENLLGKIIRIDPRLQGVQPYTVPADNPFVGIDGRDEIWSLGLRNPWRFSFDRLNGALTIGDVGQGSREEVNYLTPAQGAGRGVNFGWPCREGRTGNPDLCAGPDPIVDPVYDYSHTEDDPGTPDVNEENCSITGGYVVRDPGVADLNGRYVFTDLCRADLRSFDPLSPPATDGHTSHGTFSRTPVSFGEDSCGRVYVVDFQADPVNNVFRITGESGGACPPEPDDVTAPETTLRMKKSKPRRKSRTFLFGSTEAGSTFECKLDKRDWQACESPRKVRGLDRGRHTFSVRATDAAGNPDASPASKRFKIKPRKRKRRG